MKDFRTAIFAIILAGISGCGIYRAPVPAADYYYLNPDADLADIGRIAMVQLENNSSYQQISMDATRALYTEIQKKQRFSLKIIPKNDQQWKSLQLDTNAQLNPKELTLAAEKLQCDALMVGTVTEYAPYPHLSLGLNLKIISCRDGQVVWAFEQIWDTSDKKTEYRIKNYLKKITKSDTEIMGQELVNVSTIKFLKFVSYEVAFTL